MARKHLLDGLTDGLTSDELPAGNLPQPSVAQPQRAGAPHLGVLGTRGAIGAVARSIEQVKAQSIVDLDPSLIEASFITDRLESSLENHKAFVELIRENGQQVPILVRPHPDKQGRYQIAYGRRRLRAIIELGRTIRAEIKPLTDKQLVIAQGQENSARSDLSFIERALFAAQMEEGGFDRETIMAALSVDKTGLSRLISSAVKIPRDIIEAIGAAPRAGRDRWIELATRLENHAATTAARRTIESDGFALKDSDQRFNEIVAAAAPTQAKVPRAKVWKAEDGTRVAQIKEDARNVTLAIDKKAAGAFGAYLVEQLPEIYAAFKSRADQLNTKG
jgi:ParB family transcriptional regulator, chromosome partitioning protein